MVEGLGDAGRSSSEVLLEQAYCQVLWATAGLIFAALKARPGIMQTVNDIFSDNLQT